MDKIMNKSQLVYLSGITFVSIGLIPISRSIFSIELFNEAPIFFCAGGILFLLIIIFFDQGETKKHNDGHTKISIKAHIELFKSTFELTRKFIPAVSPSAVIFVWLRLPLLP